MKINRLLAALLAAIISLSIFAIPSFAVKEDEHIDVIIHEEVSEELKQKAVAYFLSGAHNNATDDEAATYGLTCNLFGHDYESVVSSVITHKAKTTSPRCLKKTYEYFACTRCDYQYSELLRSQYIVCCA